MSGYLAEAKRRETDAKAWRNPAMSSPTRGDGDRHSRTEKDRSEQAGLDARDRRADASVIRDARGLPIDSPTLARWCRRAALKVGKRAGIDGARDRRAGGATHRLTEVDALASAVAMRVLAAQESRERPRASARAVLAWIDRAERMPTIAAQDWRAGDLARGQVGPEYLEKVAARILTRERGWRDTAEGYRVRERSDRERHASGAIVTTHDPAAPGFMALAERRERERTGAEQSPVIEAAERVADAVADRLAEDWQLSAGERSRVRAALALDGGTSPQSVGAREGWTLGTVAARASEGRKLLRENALEDRGRLLAQVIRESAERAGLIRRVRIDSPDLSAAERAASAMVDGQLRAGEDRVAVGSPGPVTYRATRRNVRAERVAGRWGKAARAYPRERRTIRERPATGEDPRAKLAREIRRTERERVAREARAATFARLNMEGWPAGMTWADADALAAEAAGEAVAAL